MTDKRPLDDTELDALFAASRADAPVPSDELMARIVADAAAERPASAAMAGAPRPGLWSALLAGIGGWPAAAGLATATIAGLAIGLATPDTLQDLSGLTQLTGYQLEDLMPSYGDLLGEG